MVTMENAEEVMQILERFTRLKQKEIPKELDEYLGYVAKTGDTVFKWSSLKYLFREKLLNVIKQFHDATPRIDEIPQYPNVDPFNYESMKSTLLERLELFNAAPFTVQRLCELLIDPRKQYSRIDKFMRALEKNILVVSTVEPGRKRTESENGDSLDSVVNGDILLDVNVDIDMEADSLLNMESQAQNNTENTENDAATAATVNENGGDNTSIAFSLSSQEDAVESSDKANTSNEKEFAVKTMATHLADDDILPHPKKVKLDLIAQAQNEEQEDDEEEEQYREMISDALDKKDSPVKQKQETAKEINEKSADNISDEQAKKNDLENGQDRQEEPQKADREKPHNFEEVKEASDDENVKVNVDTGVVATIPVIATTIAEINEKGKPTAAMTRMTTTVTSVDNENIEINSVNEDTEQSIREHQVVQQKQGKVNNEQSTNVDAINKIQAAEDEEPRTEEKALLVVEEEKREEEKQLKNLPQNKTSDCSDSTKTPTSEPQQIIASAKGEKGESTAAETVVEKQELEKCEKEQNNIKITNDDKNGDKIAQETLKKVEEQINEQNDENNEEKTKETQQQRGEDNAKVERHERGENVLREDEELLELQLLSNKTEELVEVIENNQVETIHEDLEENSAETEDKLENVIDEKEESKNITLDKKKADNYKIDTDSAAINLPKEVNVNLEKCSNEEEKSERKSLVEIVEHQVQQKEPVEIIESEKYEQEHKEVENAECEIDTAAALQSTTAESSTVATAKELEILNEIALQTANTASRLNNETKICETLGMATEIPTTVTTDNFSQQQILGGDVVVAAEPSISSDSIIMLPTAIEQTPAPTSVSVLTNISTQGEQPMIQDVTIEEEAPPTVEEVVMAEPPSQPLSSSQQLIASITSVTSAPAIMDVESSCMEVDDTSQEAMDQ